MTTRPELLAGRYRLGQLLGRGGMSDVYRALDERTGTAVAVKMVRSGDPELARRLAQEVRMMGRFEHPGLIRLLDTGVAGDQAYLVMELVEGPTLAERLREGPLTPKATAALGATLADALADVHRHGIVHRDIKPANVLLSEDGRPMLADFGIARLVDASSLTVAGTTLGTAAYMAPEQLEDHQVGPAADIWSLGMVLVECLTGRRLYQGTASEVVARRLAGPVPLPSALPVPWKVLLSGMLDHRPAERLSAAEAAGMLATGPLQAPWDPSGPPTEDLAPTARHDLTALAPGGALAGAAAAGAAGAMAATTPIGRAAATALRPGPPAPPGGPVGRPGRHYGRWLVGAVVVVALVALALLLARSPSGPPVRSSGSTATTAEPPRRAAPRPPATTTPSTDPSPTTTTTTTTSTTSTTTTTTTTAPPPPSTTTSTAAPPVTLPTTPAGGPSPGPGAGP